MSFANDQGSALNFDIHHHFIPEVYRKALQKWGVKTSGGASIKNWKIQDSIELMNRLGIQTALGSISEPGLLPIKDQNEASLLAREVNEFMARVIQDYPQRFGAFALIPLPDVEAALDEIHYALDVLKLDGIGLLSNYETSYLGDTDFDPVFDELNRRKAVVFIHPSSPPASFRRPEFIPYDFVEEFTFNTTRAVSNLIFSGTIARCPDIRFVLAHGGGTIPFLRGRIGEIQRSMKSAFKHPISHVKDLTQYSREQLREVGHLLPRVLQNQDPEVYMRQFYYDTALTTDQSPLSALMQTTTITHILYGSDAHFATEEWCHKMKLQIREYEGFGEAGQRQILYENALHLFPRFIKS
ncbi:amidohydrolase family protein [Paenibacillus kribbensis]|uniref:amidohydrolase family protein n=1 Tax=Paenibacillus kribbensis TaxID=172713 RepID=UPI002DB74F80|nr:amidohydrolase family protein [Paenibacillus kribbensis]MEC0234174.1 amidohydrolase family protein [Paenibacillus kribbensis]